MTLLWFLVVNFSYSLPLVSLRLVSICLKLLTVVHWLLVIWTTDDTLALSTAVKLAKTQSVGWWLCARLCSAVMIVRSLCRVLLGRVRPRLQSDSGVIVMSTTSRRRRHALRLIAVVWWGEFTCLRTSWSFTHARTHTRGCCLVVFFSEVTVHVAMSPNKSIFADIWRTFLRQMPVLLLDQWYQSTEFSSQNFWKFKQRLTKNMPEILCVESLLA